MRKILFALAAVSLFAAPLASADPLPGVVDKAKWAVECAGYALGGHGCVG